MQFLLAGTMESIILASQSSALTSLRNFFTDVFKGSKTKGAVCGILALVLYEQAKNWHATRGMNGPKWSVPFIGGILGFGDCFTHSPQVPAPGLGFSNFPGVGIYTERKFYEDVVFRVVK